MRWFFGFFFVSGFCSILYEIIWLRLAMAQFGVTSALISIVLSMFMAGLGLGSWGSGRLIRKYRSAGLPPLAWYAITELLIGTGAVLVPHQLLWGRNLLERFALSSSWTYYSAVGAWIALTLVPWCACMGATIPVGMLAIRESFRQESERSFSFLYLANVLGALAGATISLLLIELYGFHGTLRVGVGLNGLLAVSAMSLVMLQPPRRESSTGNGSITNATPGLSPGQGKLLGLLFATGLTSMGMEVVWIRQFTPYLSTMVYAFACILGLYLGSTFIGSRVYRRLKHTHDHTGTLIWALLAFFALLPVITADPRFPFSKLLRLTLGIVPFSTLLGYVTPMLVDRFSGGDPDRAGRAYAVNVVGCILGPLLSGFILLPWMSESWVLLVLALPWLVLGVYARPARTAQGARAGLTLSTRLSYTFTVLALALGFAGKDYEDLFLHREVLRDHTATIIATGEGLQKQLLVNGWGITTLTPITKMMAHLPLAFLDRPPQNALVVCFGMGTTYRSLLSWNIPTTAVELIPSVPKLFWYFHADGPELLRSPLSRVVVDDGRRYLERTSEQYDVITLDPPPPVEAAGSSLLYSKEFYATVKQRLRAGGILLQWLPYGDEVVHASVARALKESFPYVRVFLSSKIRSARSPGFYFLASSRPLPDLSAAELAKRMPAKAVADLTEWGPEPTAERNFAKVLANETSLDAMIAEAPQAPALQDDRPENEYYLLRRRLLPEWKR
jgi:spermidine synthase